MDGVIFNGVILPFMDGVIFNHEPCDVTSANIHAFGSVLIRVVDFLQY